MWSNDNSEKFPWQVSTNQGGTIELVGSGDPLPHFKSISNEVNTPKVLVCSGDTSRVRVKGFDQLTSSRQLSYFAGVDASELRPNSILTGDRTISTDGCYHSGLVSWAANSSLQWAPWIHPAGLGNIGFGDGSVQQVTNGASWFQRAEHTNPVIRLVIP
jgi:prepilin-type processing-associated H-X9-DG protein